MEGTLLVTPEKLKETATGFQSLATQVKALHDDMLNRIQGLSWEGTAADAYKTKFGALRTSMDKINSMINEHVRDLNDMADQYINAETQAQNAADSLPPSTLD